jgi:hypothetical protein
MAKDPKHNYKIETSACSSTSAADGGLTQKRKDLIKKLDGAKTVSTDFKTIKTEFTGIYELHKTNGVKGDLQGTFTSENSWEDVIAAAKKDIIGDLSDYTGKFIRADYLKLSIAQKDAITPKRRPAGTDSINKGYTHSCMSSFIR